MSENKEPIKISLKVILLMIILLLIIIVSIVWYVRSNFYSNKSLSEQEALKSSEDTEVVAEENKKDATTSDLNIDFLKFNNDEKNMIYSPLSIKYALAMLKEGAENNTKKQIEDVLGDIELTKYENIENTLSLANGLFIRDTYKEKVKSDFSDTLIQKYNAEVKYDEFRNATNINKWIEEKTFGILKNVVQDENMQNPNLELILVNALAIDIEWEKQFDEQDTYGQEFTLSDGSKVDATMMHTEFSEGIDYYKEDDIVAARMNLKEYNDVGLEFVAIMPEKIELDKYIEEFNAEEFNKLLDEMKPASEAKKGVALYIPRFDYEYELPLKENLQRLGIADAFNQVMADFSKISDTGLYVSDAIHKADIEISEKGVKAAAVTMFMMLEGIVMEEEEKPIELVFNKPFLYVIRDKNTGEIWFVGTVYEPNLWEDDKSEYQY